MPLFLHNNMSANLAERYLKFTTKQSMEASAKLSSGYKINKAADDAAGLAMSEKLRRRIRGLNKTLENIEDGIGYVDVADGALAEVDDMLHRMNELAIKSANGTLTDIDRGYIQMEIGGLRDEIDSIFTGTTFNEKYIWRPLDWEYTTSERVITPTSSYRSIGVTNLNSGVMPISNSTACGYGYIYMTATVDDGLSFNWTGENGKSYTSKSISWDELESCNYSFNLSDLFDETDDDTYSDLVDSDGNPVLDLAMSFSVSDHADIEQIAENLNGGKIQTNMGVSLSAEWENPTTPANISGIKSVSVSASMNYDAAYAFNRDFDAKDDVFLEPQLNSEGGNLSTYPTASEPDNGWTFKFETQSSKTSSEPHDEGSSISLSAKCNSLYYYVSYTPSNYSHPTSENTDNYYGEWWGSSYYSWYQEWRPGITYKYLYNSNISLTGMEKGFTGQTNTHDGGTYDSDAYPGILNQSNGGHNPYDNGSGTFVMGFNITADSAYNYGEEAENASDVRSSTSVGSMTISVTLDAAQSYSDAVNAITSLFNGTTVLDLYSSGASADSFVIYPPIIGDGQVSFGEMSHSSEEWYTLNVQAGTESSLRENVIPIRYYCLDIDRVGLSDIDVSTEDNARKAIGKVRNAQKMVDGQRTLFGAYHNRLSSARQANENSMINEQEAESKIRDTDMASEMVRLSTANILREAGYSMLSQANRNPQKIIELLNG